MALPMISVLLPVRDAEATVGAAMASVLQGTHRHLELLAVDDGSKDGTRAELFAQARADPRVRVLDAGGQGLVAALELARAQAQAPRYLARMDADDLSHPERLERCLAALEEDPTLWAVGTQVEIFSRGGAVSPNLKRHEEWMNGLTTCEALYSDRLVESPLCHPSALLRREALERAGGWKDEGVPEDWALWLSMLEAGGRLRAVTPVLYRWADHPQRLTRTHQRYAWGALQRLKARHLFHTLRGRPATLWGAGELGLALFRELSALGAAVTRFIDVSPKKVGRTLLGLPVLPPEEVGQPGRGHLIAAVGAKGARAEIRAFLAARGWLEGADFTCAG